jgi:hypothetical protein
MLAKRFEAAASALAKGKSVRIYLSDIPGYTIQDALDYIKGFLVINHESLIYEYQLIASQEQNKIVVQACKLSCN